MAQITLEPGQTLVQALNANGFVADAQAREIVRQANQIKDFKRMLPGTYTVPDTVARVSKNGGGGDAGPRTVDLPPPKTKGLFVGREKNATEALERHFEFWARERKWTNHPLEALDHRVLAHPEEADALHELKSLVSRYARPDSGLSIAMHENATGALAIELHDRSSMDLLLDASPVFIRHGRFFDPSIQKSSSPAEFANAVDAAYAGKTAVKFDKDPPPSHFKPLFLARFPDGRYVFIDMSSSAVPRAFIGVPGNMQQIPIKDWSNTGFDAEENPSCWYFETEAGTFVTGQDMVLVGAGPHDKDTRISTLPTGFLAASGGTPIPLESIGVDASHWERPKPEALQIVKSLGVNEDIAAAAGP